MIGEANAYLTGWVTYFRHARSHSELRGLDGWLRRKLRCVRLKQCKQPKGLRRFLCQHGVSSRQARELASSGRGWWCLANSPQAKIAMDISWFHQQGLINLSVRHTALNAQRNRRGTTRTPGGVRGGDREEPPYSIVPWAPAFAGVTQSRFWRDMSPGDELNLECVRAWGIC
jgi:hypothetical protein